MPESPCSWEVDERRLVRTPVQCIRGGEVERAQGLVARASLVETPANKDNEGDEARLNVPGLPRPVG